MDTTDPRYAPGGEFYAAYTASYGVAGAERIWAAYQRGGKQAVPAVIGDLKNPGTGGSTSTLGILATQLVTDPLGAPLESANRVLGNTVWSFFRAPWVLLLLLLGLLLYFAPFLRTVLGKRAA